MISLIIHHNHFTLLSQERTSGDITNLAAIARAVLIYKNPLIFDAEKMANIKGWAVPKYLPRLMLMAVPLKLSLDDASGYTQIPMGLLLKVQEYTALNNIQISVTDTTQRFVGASKEEKALFGKDYIPIPSLREYQNEIVSKLASVRRAQAVSMTGSGKTIMMAALIKHFGIPTIILCHRVLLIHQWEAAIKSIIGENPHKLYGGKVYQGDEKTKIVIASFRSIGENAPESEKAILSRRVQDPITHLTMTSLPASEDMLKENKLEMLSKVGMDIRAINTSMVIVDEAHVAPAFNYYNIASSLSPSLLYGCTATPDRKDGRTMFAEAIFTDRKFLTDYEDVKDYLTPLKYITVLTPGYFDNSVVDKIGGESAMLDSEFLKILTSDPIRMCGIIEIIKALYALGKTAAIVCANNLWLVDILADAMTDLKIPFGIITGSIKQDDRVSIIKRTIDRTNNIIIATTTMDEGIDIPNLDAILFPVPFTSKTVSIQRAGRVARKCAGKNVGMVIDFRDPLVAKAEIAFFSRRRHIVSTFGVTRFTTIKPLNQIDIKKELGD